MVEYNLFNECLQRGFEEKCKDFRTIVYNEIRVQLTNLCEQNIDAELLKKELFKFLDDMIAERYYKGRGI